MILSYEIGFWLIKIFLFVLLLFVLIVRILSQFDKNSIFGSQRKNLKFFLLTLLIFTVLFRGTIIKLPSTFPDKSIDFLYIENKIDLYGFDEINYRKYSVSSDIGVADFYKFDDIMSFKESHLNDLMQSWNLSKRRTFKDFSLAHSNLERCREQSPYIYAYNSWYEGWLLLEKNEEVIVVNYYYKANFKWYDYLIVINEPTIPDDFISVLLSSSDGN